MPERDNGNVLSLNALIQSFNLEVDFYLYYWTNIELIASFDQPFKLKIRFKW